MTQAQINELYAFAAAEIARHEAGLTIQGGTGVSVSGEGLDQSISVQVPRVVTEEAEAETWKLFLYLKIEWSVSGIDANGDSYQDGGGGEEWESAAVFERDGTIRSSYAWERTQFGYLPPDDDSPSFIQRDVSLRFALHAVEKSVLARVETPPFEAGTYRIPLRLELDHIIAAIDSGADWGTTVRTDHVIVNRNGAHYTPHRTADGEWYEIRLAGVSKV